MNKDLKLFKIIFIIFLLPAALGACASLMERTGEIRPAANLVITPLSALPKSIITIRGSGFVPQEKIELLIMVDGVPIELGEEPMIKEANDLGAFKVKSGVPFNAKPGMYTVRAIGDKGTVAVAPLEVEQKKK